MDPISQILAQSQAASAGGQSLGVESFVAGRRMVQEDRRMALEESKLSMLQQTAFFNNRMEQLKYDEAVLNQRKLLKIQEGAVAASAMVVEALDNRELLDSPEWTKRALAVYGNPFVPATDQGKQLFGMIQARQAVREATGQGLTAKQSDIDTLAGRVVMSRPEPGEADRVALEKRRLDLVEKELDLREKAATAKAKGETREAFVRRNATDLMKSSTIPLEPKEAVRMLGEVFDRSSADPFGLFGEDEPMLANPPISTQPAAVENPFRLLNPFESP